MSFGETKDFIADIQKRTLLAAAVHFKDGNSPIGATVADELERLADEAGRQ